MAMHLITGHSGTAHISAADDGALNAAIVGDGSYVFDFGDDFAANMVTANSVTIGTGALVHQGRKAWCSTSTSLMVESGSQAQRRNDLVVARYTKDGDVEDMQLVVIKGTPVSYGDPSDPSHEDGSVIDGATVSDFPLWRIPIDGITPGTPKRLFDVTPSLAALRDSVSQNTDDIAALGQMVSVRQDQTWDDIEVTAYERAGIVTVTVTRMGKSGTASVLNAQSTVGHIKAGHRPAVARRQLLGCKSSGEWLYMGVDASGAVFINTMYATGTTTWGSFSGTLSYPVP